MMKPLEVHGNAADLCRVREGGEIVTDSVVIAEEFGRRHDNVMERLRSLVADGSINLLDFKEIEYLDGRGRKQPAIELTERGALVAMPFIGGKMSREGQVRLVDAFLAMREQLRAAQDSPAKVSTDPLDMVQMMINQARADQARIVKLEAFVETVPALISQEAARAPVDEPPAGTLSMRRLKRHWNEKTGIPTLVVEKVIRQLKEYRIAPTAIVKRGKHEQHDGSIVDTQPYPVFQQGIVTATMNRFIRECVRNTGDKRKVTHPAYPYPFNLNDGLAKGERRETAREIAEHAVDLK
jgi:Rha family phage regulatory protein